MLSLRLNNSKAWTGKIVKWVATHSYTGMLLPKGTEVLGEDIKIESPIQSFVSAPNATLVANNSNVFEAGETYEIEFEITNYSEGTVFLRQPQGNSERFSGNGIFTSTQIIPDTFTNEIHYRSEGVSTTLDIQTLSIKPLNTGLLKDSGKAKTNLTVGSGAMTGFNSSSQQSIDVDIDPSNLKTISFSVSILGTYNQRIVGAIDNSYNTQIHCNNTSAYYRFENRLTPAIFNYDLLSDGLHTFTFVLDASEVLLYIDGEFSSSESVTVNESPSVNKHIGFIGKNVQGYTNGQIYNIILIPQALTPTQIKYLYEYPHRAVAHFNVNDSYTTSQLPDVTASLNMPLTEVGEYKIDYSKAFGGELVTNGGFDSDLSGWTDTNSHWSWVNGRAYHPSSSVWNPLLQLINLDNSKTYLVEIDVEIVSGNLKLRSVAADIGLYIDKSGKHSFIYNAVYDDLYIGSSNTTSEFYINSIELQEVTANELSNYTVDCDLQQQTDGLPMSVFKQEKGMLIKLQEDRINLTGEEVPAIQLDMTDTELGDKWVIRLIMTREINLINSYILFSHNGVNGGLRLYTTTNWAATQVLLTLYSSNNTPDSAALIIPDNLFHTITFKNDGSNLTMRVDGVDGTPVAHNFVPSGLNFKDSTAPSPKGELRLNIWTESEYDKYDDAKSDAEALKIIAELEAE